MKSTRGPAARRPGHAGRIRAAANDAREAKREERQRAGRRMRLGFQVVIAAAVVTIAFILLVPTARLYASQQEQKAVLRAQVEAAQAANQDLEAQLKRWEDPAYVKAQARKRLSFVMPGERSYRVSDPENAPSLAPSGTPSAPPVHLDSAQPDSPDPWYSLLWDSTIVAGKKDG